MLHAEIKPGASYAWRSIMQAVGVLKEGVVNRIGNGLETEIWTEPWLPRGCSRLPITPRGHTITHKVGEFIDPVTGQWDVALVEDLFWRIGAQRILPIPLHDDFKDDWAWHYDKRCFQRQNGLQNTMAAPADGEYTQSGEPS